MFPEFFCVDLTFGTNKQRRPLLMMVGCDGYNKTFTAFRAFLPSKQARAVRWVFLQAIPKLLGSEVLHNVSCIATDEEDSLQWSISSAINLDIIPRAKQRFDFFHIFTLEWKKRVRNNDNSDIIYRWISSWFDNIETASEFNESVKQLKHFIHTLNDLPSKDQISDIVEDIISKISYCGHFHFLRHATYSYKGDSPSEAMNASLKYGSFQIDAKHNIDSSAILQLDHIEHRQRNRNMYRRTY